MTDQVQINNGTAHPMDIVIESFNGWIAPAKDDAMGQVILISTDAEEGTISVGLEDDATLSSVEEFTYRFFEGDLAELDIRCDDAIISCRFHDGNEIRAKISGDGAFGAFYNMVGGVDTGFKSAIPQLPIESVIENLAAAVELDDLINGVTMDLASITITRDATAEDDKVKHEILFYQNAGQISTTIYTIDDVKKEEKAKTRRSAITTYDLLLLLEIEIKAGAEVEIAANPVAALQGAKTAHSMQATIGGDSNFWSDPKMFVVAAKKHLMGQFDQVSLPKIEQLESLILTAEGSISRIKETRQALASAATRLAAEQAEAERAAKAATRKPDPAPAPKATPVSNPKPATAVTPAKQHDKTVAANKTAQPAAARKATPVKGPANI